MSVDEFGLGAWWPRPGQAAAGALDHLPVDQWPTLAAKWLAAGFDSPLLRQVAELQTGRQGTKPSAEDGPASWAAPRGLAIVGPAGNAGGPAKIRVALQVLDLMPQAMRSIGFDPAPADEAFVARCQSAVDIVQHDLDATGYGQYRMRARFGRGWPATVHATLPDGSYWGGGEGMARQMEGSWLLVCAADSVSATLKEVPEIEWPVCAVHGGHPDSIWAGEEPVGLIKRVAWWRCTNTGHALAPVGQLTAKIARTPQVPPNRCKRSMNGHIVIPFRRRPEPFDSPSPKRHASSGWGKAPLGSDLQDARRRALLPGQHNRGG